MKDCPLCGGDGFRRILGIKTLASCQCLVLEIARIAQTADD